MLLAFAAGARRRPLEGFAVCCSRSARLSLWDCMILLMRRGFGKGMQRLEVDEQKRWGLQVSDLSDGPVLLDSTEAIALNGDVAIASAKERKPSFFRFLPFSLSTHQQTYYHLWSLFVDD